MAKQVDKTTLGYLGKDFQIKLVKCFFEDSNFFIGLEHIIDQNMFTVEELRTIVGFLKDRYEQKDIVSTYEEMNLLIRSKISDAIRMQYTLEMLKIISESNLSGIDIIEEESGKFFKQQNLVKAINKSMDIIKKGDFNNYPVIEDMIKNALADNTKEYFGWELFDDIEKDLREDYRTTISTGTPELDEALYGGLGKGELGIIVAPSGVGKAQPLHSRILTPTGYKTMGEIEVGDYVIGGDGQKHKVIGTFPQGIRPVYRVDFSNGTSCECDIDHLWCVNTIEGTSKTLSLRDIIKEGIKTEDKYKFTIPRNKTFHSDHISIENRREFLRKIIDNFPVTSNKEIYKISYRDKHFIESLCFLVRSLGYYAVIGCVGDGKYSLLFTQDESYKINITEIEYLDEKETKCILLDSEDHTYITEDFIVTHNTSLCTGFAVAASMNKCKENNYKGYKVLHFYFEDEDTAIRRKYYGNLLDIDAMSLHLPDIRPFAIKRLNELRDSETCLKDNIRGERLQSGEVTATDIRRKIDSHTARGFKPDLVIIDYFECLKPERDSNYSDSEWTKEGVTMRKLESICNEKNIAIWVPVQGTKGSIGADFVGLMHAGGSVSKVQIGHVVITLARTDDQKSQGRLNMYIQKLRAVKIGRDKFINVQFNNGTGKFDMSDMDTMDNPGFDQTVSYQNKVAKDIRDQYGK